MSMTNHDQYNQYYMSMTTHDQYNQYYMSMTTHDQYQINKSPEGREVNKYHVL
jgi:hypothetical protein